MTLNGLRAPSLALALLSLLGAASAPARQGAQTAPAQRAPQGTPQEDPEAAFEDQVSVGYVLVPLVVRTPSGGYAKNLDAGDFHLLVDGRRVVLGSFEQRAEAPASVVFLQDLSGSMAGEKLELSRRVVRFFLDKSLPGDEFAVASFAGGRNEVEIPFTADASAVREAIDLWEGYGTTGLHDAVAWMPDISLEGHNPKRFAVVITDGVDNASSITPAQAREIVRRAQLPVYVLGMGTGNPFDLTAKGEKVYRYADVLNLLAHETGGRYFALTGPGGLDEALNAIAEDLRHQYVLGFATGQGKARFRDLKVEVAGKNRSVLFRKGYQGPPPAELMRGG